MDLRELETYRLGDAVKFNDQLNPRLWGSDEHLLPEVREKLLAIADDFRESLGIDVEVKDITISGSNAAYTYTPHSDIDLHLVVDLPRADESDVYRELFDAKKYQYNDSHDFKIGGYDVELYVQDARKPHHSQGIYSIKDNEWLRVPNRRRPEVDDISVRSKYEDLGQRIDAAIESGDLERMDAMAKKIRDMRQAGLDQHGEFGPENLAFKVLRGNGTLDRLRKARLAAKDQEMSLQERRKRKKKTRYGFGGYWYPGFSFGTGSDAGSDGGDAGGESQHEDYDPNAEPPGPEFKPEMPAGTILVNVSDVYDWYKLGQDISDLAHANPEAYGKGAPQTVLSFGSEPIEHMYKQDLDRLGLKTLDIDRRAKVKDPEGAFRMDEDGDKQSIIEKFIKFTANQVGIETMPRIRFKRDPAWSRRNNTFGRYVPEEHTLYVSLADRHILDIMRTVAHELTHHRQNEIESMPDHSGDTGSDWENEANAAAGIIMRRFSDLHPELFQEQPVDESLRGKLGAAAAAACVAGTPGCATTGADVLRGVQDIGRAAQTFRGYKKQDAQAEINQELQNWIRRQGGHTDQPTKLPLPDIDTQNENIQTPVSRDQKSHDDYYSYLEKKARLGRPLTRQEQEFIKTYKLTQQMRSRVAEEEEPTVTYDIPYTAIVRPERLRDVRRFGKISHYKTPGVDLAMIHVPVSQERAFVDRMAQQGVKISQPPLAEASGYIPTEREKNDPRFSMALTVDVQPGETGRQANKLGLKTDSQGRPELLMKRLNNLLESVKAGGDEPLLEVRMSPGELQRWAQSPEAEGIQAGFEAELIFRDTAREDGGESEPDYDADERAYSVQQVRDFFESGDMGIGSGTANRLESQLYDEYYDWANETVDSEWQDNEQEQVQEWMEDNVWDSDQDQYRERAAEELELDTEDLSADESNKIEERARELFAEDVETAVNERNDNWQSAYDEFSDERRDESDLDEESFFRDRYRYMSDVQNAYSLDWPYWTEGSYSEGRTNDDIANSLSSALGGAEVRASSGYHSTSRKPGRWIVEPDGSLDPDEYEDAGLEVVSPPMPLPEALRSLRTVIDWANGDGDAYTNRSTGLHMGVSIPHKGGDVDYVKLILFLGDQYVLDQFGRAANSYTRSALDKLKNVQRSRRSTNEAQGLTGAEKTAAAMDLMRKNLIELAQRYVQDGVGKDKYTSAHIKDGYIEFRSPGGDYLSMNDRDESALATTMLRFARAMQIAGRPDVERKEYSKKLYKLLSGFKSAEISKPASDTKYKTRIETEGDNDALELFARYSTGQITPEELKKDWARRVLAKEQPSKPSGGKYEIYNKDTGEVLDVVGGDNEADLSLAVAHALEKFSGQGITFGIRKQEEPGLELSRRAKVAKRIQTKKQAADNAQDSEDLENRLQGTEQRYRVQWTEQRNGREVADSLVVTARNATAAMDQVRSALEAQGRRPAMIQADQAPVPGSTLDRAQQRAQQAAAGSQREYQIYSRATNNPVIGFMAAGDDEALDRLRRYRLEHPDFEVGVRTGGGSMRTQTTPQGEWTGHWIVKDAQGRELTRFHGIGNVQADANRHAARWLGTNRPDLAGQDIEVVPEMR